MSAVLAVITLASLIAALAINSQAISFVRTRLFQYTNAYAQDNNAMDVTDKIQSRYECCGVNLWLDWASISLGVTGGTGSSTRMTNIEERALILFLFSLYNQKRVDDDDTKRIQRVFSPEVFD